MNQSRGNATSVSSRHGGNKATLKSTLPNQKVLDKQEVLQLRKYQRGLKDLEDERTNGMMEQIELMKEAFVLAKKKREWLAKLYKERREDILRQLSEMRKEIEVTFARLHKELKDFAADWMATKEDAVQEWEDTLEERSQEIEESFRQIRAKNAVVDAGIDQEREERTIEIDEAAKSVQDKLAEIRSNLAATTKERLEEEKRYAKDFKQQFERLHRILGRETEAREAQCVVDVRRCLDSYANLHIQETQLEEEVIKVYQELNLDLQVEEAERKASQKQIVQEGQSFLDQFRENLEGDIVKIRDRNQIRLGFMDSPLGKGPRE
ncbi:unnamed protein product [Amoebophrya sp. A120]|nr:unnamed protein product [Amoebophrya sp. A120]|eukprot:GSA120T00012816001.1